MLNKIGIIGGVGPFAGVDLHAKVIKNTKAVQDQDHIPIYHISCAHAIEDRTAYFYDRTLRNPALDIFDVITQLYGLGCYTVGIPCNTAHIAPIHEEIDSLLQKHTMSDMRFVHMIEEVAEYLVQNSIYRVGLLATKGTYASKLYSDILKKYDIELCVPNEKKKELVHQSIYNAAYGIKAQSSPPSQEARMILQQVSKDLQDEYTVQAIIMGCTEIPVVLFQNMVDTLLIDATDVLAKALIRYSNPEKLIH